jgi:transposase
VLQFAEGCSDRQAKELATVFGTDGKILLDALDAAIAHRWLQEIPAVHTLRQVWGEPYVNVQGRLMWCEVRDMPSPAELIASPHDPEARYSTKRDIAWVGYQVHLTETCLKGSNSQARLQKSRI